MAVFDEEFEESGDGRNKANGPTGEAEQIQTEGEEDIIDPLERSNGYDRQYGRRR